MIIECTPYQNDTEPDLYQRREINRSHALSTVHDFIDVLRKCNIHGTYMIKPIGLYYHIYISVSWWQYRRAVNVIKLVRRDGAWIPF